VRRYYVLIDDKQVANRWFLKGPITSDGATVDPRIFFEGRRYDADLRMTLPLRRKGNPLDFTLADFDMPVLRTDYAKRLAELAPSEVQYIPVDVAEVGSGYSILNVLETVRCLDEEHSGVTYWKAAEGQPQRDGEYRMVLTPRVDPSRVGSRHIFRIAGWEIAMIVSEEAKALLQGASGVSFEPA